MKALLLILTTTFIASQSFALDCAGTEPFWGATLSSDKIEVTDVVMEESITVMPVTEISGAHGYTSEFLQVYSNQNGPVAIVTSNSCNDGMSDFTYPKEVIIFTGTGTLYGCCGEGKL